jgi:hypothetical protein
MSWSLTLVGKKEKVASEAARIFSTADVTEGEKGLRDTVAAIVAAALAALPAGTAVTVSSEAQSYGRVSLDVEPISGFLG